MQLLLQQQKHSYMLITQPGFNYTITNNYIGGTAPNCGGSQTILTSTATTALPTFRGIYFATGVGTASTISGNTIANISMTSATASTPALLIHGGGSANITGNTFGSQSATGNITYTNCGTSIASTFYGLLRRRSHPRAILLFQEIILEELLFLLRVPER